MKAEPPLTGSGAPSPLLVVLPLSTVALFTASASWTLFAMLSDQLDPSLKLYEYPFALLLAVPVLLGSVAALAMGALSRWLGGRRVIAGCLFGLMLALVAVLRSEGPPGLLLTGAGFSLAGGLFGAGLQYVASHSPRERLGLSLTCYTGGMLGVLFTYLVVPLVQSAYERQLAPVAHIAITLLALVLLLVLTKSDALELPTGALPDVKKPLQDRGTAKP